MESFGLPKDSEEEKKSRAAAIESASQYAMEIPMRTAVVAYQAMDICEEMIERGNPNSITDAGVGVLCIRAAVLGAIMNVRINAGGIKDKHFTERLLTQAHQLEQEVLKREDVLRQKVSEQM
jgi:glutamate formiminotransferase/formiminotetrahydrofolate cyclodeaminase